jgi:cytochrome b subunit of formate dehydrogenase
VIVQRHRRARLWAIVAGAVVWMSSGSAVAATSPASDAACAECHDQPQKIAGSAHVSIPCQTCHPKHEGFPHPEGIPKPTCASCHSGVAAQNRLGVHGLARAHGNAAAPDCTTCHGDIHQVQRTGTEAFRKSIPGICGMCHDQIKAEYVQSVHGKAAAAGIVAAPVCSTCHGEHQIQAPSTRTSPVNPLHIPETCGRCHGDVTLVRRFNLPRDTLVSFQASFHGVALKAGEETVANCASCHGVHEILPSSDPRSTINPKNLPKTCGKCHPGAGTHFAIGHMHWVGRSAPAPVRWVRGSYLILIPLVLGLMLLHNLGDWIRKIFRLRLRPAPNGEFRIPAPATVRMLRFERIEHGLLILSFSTLVWTGFALKYPDQWWAWPLLAWESGWAVRGTIHRIAGVVLIGLALAHVVSLLVDRNLRAHWKTLRPLRTDVSEGVAGFAYSLGLLGSRPRISSHSYMEKVEYWAVVWGTAVMAITGVMLWANTFVLTWLPKVVLDVAGSIHFYEAVLATLAIVIWHFYLVIFDPEVYPVDPAWLTGRSVRRRETEEEEG